MGWTTFHKPKNITPKQYFQKEYRFGDRLELVDIETKNKVAYMAVRDKEKDYVFALVYLLHYSPRSYNNFGYKDMSEFVGPNVDECPKKILKLLTPLEEIAKKSGDDISDSSYEWAKNWRNRCEENINKGKNKPFSEGTIIKTETPLEFNRIGSRQYFKKMDRKVYAVELEGDDVRIIARVRMNPKNFNYEIIKQVK
jgi:hypothetical protein